VDLPDAADDWTNPLPGVTVDDRDGTRWTLRLPERTDDQEVLAAALRTGPVREFRPVRPTLAELYRDVVTDIEKTPSPDCATRPETDAEVGQP
jgi:ABC-2 type transport system ATP-binding protein